MAKFSKGRGYSKNDLTESGYPIILYGDMYTNYQSIIRQSNKFAIKKDNSIVSSGTEVIIPSSGESAFEISRASAIVTKGIILAGDLNILKPSSNISPEFLAMSISNHKIQKQLSKMAQGNSVVHLYNSDIKNLKYNYPSINEQWYITGLLIKIDKLITLYQRKIHIILNYKSRIISLYFDRKHNRTIKLSNLELEFSYGVNAKATEYDENNRYLRITDIDESTRKLKSNTFMSPDISQDEIQKYLLQKGDIVFARTGSVGRTYLYDTADQNIVFAGYLIKTNFKNYELAQFVFHFSISNSYKRYIHMISQRSIQPGLNIDDLKDMRIPYLSNSDMKKINSEINKLNKMIHLSYNKLKNWRRLKEYYLNKLFI